MHAKSILLCTALYVKGIVFTFIKMTTEQSSLKLR